MTLQLDLALLILLAAFAHAAWNALIKASGNQFLTFAMLRAVAFVGGLGSVVYDMSIFTLFRQHARKRVSEFLKTTVSTRQRLPRWLLPVVGAVIIASPLPDELAAGFLGLSSMKVWKFLVLSFLLNALGIFVIVALGR